MDDDLQLAQAIANSLGEHSRAHEVAPANSLANYVAQDDSDLDRAIAVSLSENGNNHVVAREELGLDENQVELAKQIEESMHTARRQSQLAEDAALASHLATADSFLSFDPRERQRMDVSTTEVLGLDDDQVELAKQIEDSMQTARRQSQLAEDADLASDLAVTDSVLDFDIQEQQQAAHAAAVEATRERQQRERYQGSWDCPACTYQNRPYQQICRACRQQAPDHVLTFCSIPASCRFGVELELIVPNGKRDGLDCSRIARDLTKLGVKTTFTGYTHEVMKSWKIVTDASLRSDSNHDLCFEVVSPILKGESGLEELRLLLESIRSIGIAINSTCGFHVHIDAERGQTQGIPGMAKLTGLQQLVQAFVALEHGFDAIVARGEASQQRKANRHRYCQSNVLALGTLSNNQRWSRLGSARLAALVEMVNPGCDRYRKLNLTNLIRDDRPSTVEFRQHGGVTELLAAEAWVRLCVRFCIQTTTSNQTPAFQQCLLPQGASQRDELEALFRLIDCQGLEAYYRLDRQLTTVPNTSTGEWKCKHPRCRHRFFNDSRSLSQHARATGHPI